MEKTINCPYCQTQLILVLDKNFHSLSREVELEFQHKEGLSTFSIHNELIICTNPQCKEAIFGTKLYTVYKSGSRQAFSDGRTYKKIGDWNLLPDSLAKSYSMYSIPQAIIEDYEEACKILTLSPKASATLLRRCLQGMIRDFWKITNTNLNQAIIELKPKIDEEVWDAIETVRGCGNIGAHMENDINIIVSIDEDEADKLKWLIEELLGEWYVKRERRRKSLVGLKELGEKKKEERKNLTTPQ